MAFLARLFEIFDNRFYLLKDAVMRKAPRPDAPIAMALEEGTCVEKIDGDDADDWMVVSAYVNGENRLGFVESRALTTFAPVKKPIGSVGAVIDEAMLRQVAPRAKTELLKAIIKGSASVFTRYGLVNEVKIAHFLSQILIESAYFTTLEENLMYRAERLREVFPTRFSMTEAVVYAGRPEAIANRAYGLKIGNGDEASGDGWKFRGRGFIQLTGRANYRDIGKYLGVDLERNPDALLTPALALEAACCFFQVRGCVKANSVMAVTKLINPALMHLKQRETAFNTILKGLT